MNITATMMKAIDEGLEKEGLGICVSVGDEWGGFSPVKIEPPKEISDYFRRLRENLKNLPGFAIAGISVTASGYVDVKVNLLRPEGQPQ